MGGRNGGRYVQCDHPGCEETFSLNLPWPHDGETILEATKRGWRCDALGAPNRADLCPKHAGEYEG